MTRLILYGTAGCHLCEEAATLVRAVLAQHALALEWAEVDIAETPELIERYGVRVPMLRCPDSGAELGWPFDGARVGEFLQVIGLLSP